MNKVLVTAALCLVFGTSAYMSIYGLTAVFSGSILVVICMGAGMELGKILTVVHLHRNWKQSNILTKFFYIMVVGTLTLITSVEVMGFLSQQHTITIQDLKTTESTIELLDQEAMVLESQITETDKTLDGLPRAFVTKRFREREKAGYFLKQNRLLEIKREQTKLNAQYISSKEYAGPVFSTARILGVDEQKTISIFILILVAILEPLSIGLTIATSAAWNKMKPEIIKNSDIQIHRKKSASRMADPAETARTANPKPAKTAETAKAANEAAKTANKTAEDLHPYTIEFREMRKRHTLSLKVISDITGRRQQLTVGGWLNERPVIPIKSLRLLRKWARQRPLIRLVENG